MNLIPLLRLPEHLGPVRKLRLKSIFDLWPDLVTAVPDSRTNRRPQLCRIASKMFSHLANALFDDSLHGSSPSRMKNSNGSVLGIDHDHRQAIGSEHRKQQPG